MDTTARLQLGARFVLAAIFAYAAIGKSSQSYALASIPTMFTDWSSSSAGRWIFIGAEAALALWLVSGVRVDVAGAIVVILLSAFIGLIIMELAKDHPKPCGCMGVRARLDENSIRVSLQFDLIRNGLMTIAAAWLYLCSIATHGQTGLHQATVSIIDRLMPQRRGNAI